MSESNSFLAKLRRLRPLSYLRELSVVMIGILSTLTITDMVSEAARQREIRESYILVRMELQSNLDRINWLEESHLGELRFFKLLKKHIDDVYSIPADTIWRYDPIGLVTSFHPVYDAYEVFKVSGLMQYAKDKNLLTDLMQTYSAIENVNEGLDIYARHKSDALEGIYDGKDFASLLPLLEAFDNADPYPHYITCLQHDRFKFFVYQVEGIGIVRQNIDYARRHIERMIEKIDREYGK